MDFKILIDDFFSTVTTDVTSFPIDKKKVLSLVNDYKDGQWRYSKFQDFIWNNIAETALSYSERQSLVSQPLTQLTDAAKKLRFPR